ncbi:hypothetical protein AAFF_G00280200 [Aldrovandia affinis]|uniref:FBX41/ZN365 C2H2-type zinc finger domain-containing protein n=1 Tax=Aldrovandia affinis TaxID=143900 RepID=A0AAD7W186_9TELE|nr:hypothetical protein AAFF_G00280200 [Aldrovandia affinis]
MQTVGEMQQKLETCARNIPLSKEIRQLPFRCPRCGEHERFRSLSSLRAHLDQSHTYHTLHDLGPATRWRPAETPPLRTAGRPGAQRGGGEGGAAVAASEEGARVPRRPGEKPRAAAVADSTAEGRLRRVSTELAQTDSELLRHRVRSEHLAKEKDELFERERALSRQVDTAVMVIATLRRQLTVSEHELDRKEQEVITIHHFLEAAVQHEVCGKLKLQSFIENLLQRITLAERVLEYYQSASKRPNCAVRKSMSRAVENGPHSITKSRSAGGLLAPADSKRNTGSGYQTLADSLLNFSQIGCLPKSLDLSRLDDGDKALLAKLSAGGDLIAQDAQYHVKCLVSLYNKARATKTTVDEQDDINHGIALGELVSYIDDARMDALVAPVFKLVDLTRLYTTRLEQLGTVLTGRVHSTKLKDRIITYFPDLEEHKVLSISTDLGDRICRFFQKEGTVCPPELKSGLFTTGAVDNIDHNPSSTSAQDSFHGTGISLFQHPNSDSRGVQRVVPDDTATSAAHLPQSYTIVPPVVRGKCDPPVPKLAGPNKSDCQLIPQAMQMEYRWLEQMEKTVISDTPLQGDETVSWAAYHASKQSIPEEPECSVTLTSLLPLFYDQAKSVAMIRHSMDVVKRAVDILNPGQIPVITLDQPLYTLAKQIQWRWPETHGEDHFVIVFGGLHIEMAAWKTLGNLLDSSGWTGVLVLAGVASTGTADSFLKAAHVTRTRRAHQVTASSLYLLLKEAYSQYTSGLEEGQDPMPLDDWCAERVDASPQFQFWFIILQLELAVLIYVRSVREENFLLYTDALSKLVPWFFALGHTNYARWISVHLRDMVTLVTKHPSVYAQFLAGNFTVKKTTHAFSAIALDQAHEQNNALVKGDGGAVGLTENPAALRRWMVSGPEMARLISEFQATTEKRMKKTELKHHEQTKHTQVAFARDVRALTRVMGEMGNPFCEDSKDLLVLDSRDLADPAVINTLHQIEKLGQEQYDTSDHSTENAAASPPVEVMILDGAAIVNMLAPGNAKTFSEYASLVFLPYITSQLQHTSRVDIVWDEYFPDSLKAHTRKRRGKGTRRRVEPSSSIPGNWQAFLRIDENKVTGVTALGMNGDAVDGAVGAEALRIHRRAVFPPGRMRLWRNWLYLREVMLTP